MNRYEQLLDEIDNTGDTHYFDSNATEFPSMVVRHNRVYGIFFNERVYDTTADKYVALAHEKGHCDTGSVYCIHTPLITKEQCEARAKRSATYSMMPLDALIAAFEGGCANVFELSEYFEVTEDFMRFALELYEQDLRQIWREKYGE